jgi:hypothetical protein
MVTGEGPRKDAPALIRIDLVRIHADGTVHLLAPIGPAPLKFDSATPARALPLIPLDTFAASEFGMFPPRPPANSLQEPWTVATGPTRPSETWQFKEWRFVNAERCQYLVMNQQSRDWLKPMGGQSVWQRAEAVCVSTQDGTARKVHRVILHREGRAETAPTAWVEVKYELKDQANLTGQTFDRVRHDVEVAYALMTDATAPLGPKQFESRLARLDTLLKECVSTGMYREALVAARRALEAALRGFTPAQAVATPPETPVPVQIKKWPGPGEAAREIQVGGFRLSEQKGKPVALVFLKAGGETTDLALAVADALARRYSGRVAVVPLVVGDGVAAARSACERLNLALLLHDGSRIAAAYGVESVPRFAIIDAAGRVRWTFSGIGTETGYLVREELDRLLPPSSPNVPHGTIASPGSLGVPIVPPP